MSDDGITAETVGREIPEGARLATANEIISAMEAGAAIEWAAEPTGDWNCHLPAPGAHLLLVRKRKVPIPEEIEVSIPYESLRLFLLDYAKTYPLGARLPFPSLQGIYWRLCDATVKAEKAARMSKGPAEPNPGRTIQR